MKSKYEATLTHYCGLVGTKQVNTIEEAIAWANGCGKDAYKLRIKGKTLIRFYAKISEGMWRQMPREYFQSTNPEG